MKFKLRIYQGDEDYWRIRSFLREVFLLNGRRQFSWPLFRFEYCRWHCYENMEHFRMEEVVYIWETEDGKIAAVLNPESRGDVFLQVHPLLRTTQLESEMLEVAEQNLTTTETEGRRKLCVWADSQDRCRQSLFQSRGYVKKDWPEYQRQRPVELPIAKSTLPPGYTIRALAEVDDFPARSWVSWQAFHPNEPDELYYGWKWYDNIQRAQLYRRDLDLVVVAPNGEFASFCTIWFDDVTRTGAFEPVGTAPAHQRRGLGKALMAEGLRRLEKLGATLASVGGYSPEANALYASAGFTTYDLAEPWQKII
jgi:GNAT superfamily N-acetyltransferase